MGASQQLSSLIRDKYICQYWFAKPNSFMSASSIKLEQRDAIPGRQGLCMGKIPTTHRKFTVAPKRYFFAFKSPWVGSCLRSLHATRPQSTTRSGATRQLLWQGGTGKNCPCLAFRGLFYRAHPMRFQIVMSVSINYIINIPACYVS